MLSKKKRKNKILSPKENTLKFLFSKARYIAKNVIYIKKFSKNDSTKQITKDGFKSLLISYSNRSKVDFYVDRFNVKIIKSHDPLVQSAQKLRYENFFDANIPNRRINIDRDEFDNFCDHLIVIDTSISENHIVGTYRLLINEDHNFSKKFYTETEFNISKLKKLNFRILEAGRSCVHSDYRDGSIIRLLWKGLASYIEEQKIDFIIGCASFNNNMKKDINSYLSYLEHYHLAPKEYRSYPLKSKLFFWKKQSKLNINQVKIFKSLPPLIKAYIRAGAWIGKGAIFDKLFNTIDVCILLKVENIRKKYLNMKVNN